MVILKLKIKGEKMNKIIEKINQTKTNAKKKSAKILYGKRIKNIIRYRREK